MSLQHLRLYRRLHARPRLLLSVLVGVIVGLVLPADAVHHTATRLLIAWNAGALLYIVLAATMMARSSEHQMKRRAQWQDDGEVAILVFVVAAVLACVVAIAGQLSAVRDLHGALKLAHVALAGGTLLTAWAFMQIMFTLHYAHGYYAAAGRGTAPGLQFPGDANPTYGDFFYFAAVIGTSGQTADVSFVSRPLRRVGTLHCILAYFFNTTVLALLINIGAGLL